METVTDNNCISEDSSKKSNTRIKIKNIEGLKLMKTLENNSVDLILTDPPYIISKSYGMETFTRKIEENDKGSGKNMKTEEEWIKYKKKLKKPQEELDKDSGPGWSKENYLKYGSILGKKYATKTKFGKWDENFTLEQLEMFIGEYYKKLKKGGTIIIWFDLWKITTLKNLLEKYKFSKIRFIEWIKTNPIPINQKTSYLSNCREIALLAVKGTKPTFNSSYDNGIYHFPLASGKNKFHPTQKNLELFET